jgi:hypothetical protein
VGATDSWLKASLHVMTLSLKEKLRLKKFYETAGESGAKERDSWFTSSCHNNFPSH